MTKKEQIIHYIEDQIESHRLEHGDKLPSESEIAKRFSASRSTVRSALAVLETRAIIYRVHGQGTFVNQLPELSIRSGVGFTSEVQKQGFVASTKHATIERIKAPAQIAKSLNLKEGEDVWVLNRTRCADGKTIMFEVEYFPYHLMPHLTEEVAYRSIYVWLEEQGIAVFSYANQNITSILSDADLSKKLKVPVGSPITAVDLVAYTRDGIAFNCGQSYYISNNFKLSMQIHKPD